VDFTTTEDESKQLIIDAQHQKLIEESERMVKQTKNLVAYLRNDIDDQEKILAKQRVELDNLLRNLGVKDD
jgi:hypothetical protein